MGRRESWSGGEWMESMLWDMYPLGGSSEGDRDGDGRALCTNVLISKDGFGCFRWYGKIIVLCSEWTWSPLFKNLIKLLGEGAMV